MAEYVGEARTLEFRTYAEDGITPVNATTVTLRVGVYVRRGVVQTLATYTGGQVSNPATGVYTRVYQWPRAGKFRVEFSSTGTPTTVQGEDVDVFEPATWLP